MVDPGDTALEEKQLLSDDEYREMQDKYGDTFIAKPRVLPPLTRVRYTLKIYESVNIKQNENNYIIISFCVVKL